MIPIKLHGKDLPIQVDRPNHPFKRAFERLPAKAFEPSPCTLFARNTLPDLAAHGLEVKFSPVMDTNGHDVPIALRTNTGYLFTFAYPHEIVTAALGMQVISGGALLFSNGGKASMEEADETIDVGGMRIEGSMLHVQPVVRGFLTAAGCLLDYSARRLSNQVNNAGIIGEAFAMNERLVESGVQSDLGHLLIAIDIRNAVTEDSPILMDGSIGKATLNGLVGFEHVLVLGKGETERMLEIEAAGGDADRMRVAQNALDNEFGKSPLSSMFDDMQIRISDARSIVLQQDGGGKVDYMLGEINRVSKWVESARSEPCSTMQKLEAIIDNFNSEINHLSYVFVQLFGHEGLGPFSPKQ